MKPYLTPDEVAEITEPLTQGAARIKYFRRIGVKAEPRPNGQPLVLRCDFEASRQQEAANDGKPGRSDWSKFDDKVKYGRGAKEKRRQPARA